MKINREKVNDLVEEYCAGNCNRFAREVGVDAAHMYRFLKTGVGGGKKVVLGLIKFCKSKSLNFEEYIEL